MLSLHGIQFTESEFQKDIVESFRQTVLTSLGKCTSMFQIFLCTFLEVIFVKWWAFRLITEALPSTQIVCYGRLSDKNEQVSGWKWKYTGRGLFNACLVVHLNDWGRCLSYSSYNSEVTFPSNTVRSQTVILSTLVCYHIDFNLILFHLIFDVCMASV
jgi:hypothetical protein